MRKITAKKHSNYTTSLAAMFFVFIPFVNVFIFSYWASDKRHPNCQIGRIALIAIICLMFAVVVCHNIYEIMILGK